MTNDISASISSVRDISDIEHSTVHDLGNIAPEIGRMRRRKRKNDQVVQQPFSMMQVQ